MSITVGQQGGLEAKRRSGIPSIFYSPVVARIVTGFSLLAFSGAVLAAGAVAVQFLALFVTFSIVYEFLTVSLPPYRRPKITSGAVLLSSDAFLYTVAFALVPLSTIFGGLAAAAASMIAVVSLLLARETQRFESGDHEEPQKEVLTALGVTCLYPLLFGTALLGGIRAVSLVLGPDSWKVYGWFVLMVVLNDTGAYAFGMTLGKHKLAPRVSPNKSWEGAIGGLLVAVGASLPLAWFIHFPFTDVVILGLALLVSVLSQIGDLAESFLKRLYTVKDMGGILPGHGGIFDRVDGYLFAGPALYLLAFFAA